MPRIYEKNPGFRTKEIICRDLSIVLSNSELSYAAKFAVVSEVTWVWSEFHGKHRGCPYWSKKALEGDRNPKKLIHEHAIPKKMLIGWLMNMKSPSPEDINSLLSKYCIGVVVTKPEDQALNAAGLRSEMPDDWNKKNPWARYEAVGIVPVNVA